MEIIVVILIGLLLFFFVLLAMPVDLRFNLNKDETFDYQAKLCLLFGLVTIDMTSMEKRAKKKELPKKKKSKRVHFKSLVGSTRLIKRFIRLIRDLLHSFRIKELDMHCRFGLGDPADTGMLLGVLQPLLLTRKNITLEADFEEAVFEGYCKAEIRVFPIQIIGNILAFIFSLVVSTIKNSLIKKG